jgi:hypothetical protein
VEKDVAFGKVKSFAGLPTILFGIKSLGTATGI